MERAVEAFVKYQTEAEEKFRKWEEERWKKEEELEEKQRREEREHEIRLFQMLEEMIKPLDNNQHTMSYPSQYSFDYEY